ncbi:Bug family tripartite tricarboxylate transporter substrate binding protein [Bordetella petrii]|uniref:Bug family tripartite tricarboxylate transporter substrate binding protein n=1 Tax=Bordetella petrii TaxID=94624 RepID=UPI00047A748F|nr:tripartite tricarboxylate transporter substrate binding protein [Bordetella petrii]
MLRIMLAGIAAAVSALMPLHAAADSYPNKPISLVVGFAAGGGTDVLTRAFAQQLQDEIGVPVVVENRPGADSLLASQAIKSARPDGYTIYLATSTHAINPSLFSSAKFKVRDDVTPISMIGEVPVVIAISPTLPVKTLREFIDYAKAHDGQLNYATTASNTYLETAYMLRAAGLNLQRVPYKGAAPASVALMSGEVHLALSTVGHIAPLVESGKVRALAVTSAGRSTLMPDLPTASEAGMPDFMPNLSTANDAGMPNVTSSIWYALVAPPNVPADVVQRLNDSSRAVLKNPDFIARMAAMGVELHGSSPEGLGLFLSAEEAKWQKIVDDIGAKQ